MDLNTKCKLKQRRFTYLKLLLLFLIHSLCHPHSSLSLHSLHLIHVLSNLPFSLCHHTPLSHLSYRHSLAWDVVSCSCGEEGGRGHRGCQNRKRWSPSFSRETEGGVTAIISWKFRTTGQETSEHTHTYTHTHTHTHTHRGTYTYTHLRARACEWTHTVKLQYAVYTWMSIRLSQIHRRMLTWNIFDILENT